jgi:magnesium transporter
VHAILDTLIDSYFPAIDACGDTIESLEEAVIAGFDSDVAELITSERRILLTMQHRVNPQVDILARLAQRHYSFVGEAAAPYFQDVYDHALRITQNLSHYRELLGHIFEMRLAGAAQKTNEVMRRLTLVSTVFLPLTFLVGVYGMNFNYMPELTWRYGYFVIWGVMLVIAVGMWVNFRRQKWI